MQLYSLLSLIFSALERIVQLEYKAQFFFIFYYFSKVDWVYVLEKFCARLGVVLQGNLVCFTGKC